MVYSYTMNEEKMVEIMEALIEEKIEVVQAQIAKRPQFDQANAHELANLVQLREAIKGIKPVNGAVLMYA